MPETQETALPTMEEYVTSRTATAATTPQEKVETAPESATGTTESEKEETVKVSGGWQRRIDKKTKEATQWKEAFEAAERDRKILEAKLSGSTETAKPTVESGPRPRPKAADTKADGTAKYADWEAYEDDLLAWNREQIKSELSADQKKAAEASEQEKANNEVTTKFQERGNKYFETHPEDRELLFGEDSAALHIPQGSVMDAFIIDSEFPMQILKHLTENPGEVKRILALAPIAQAKAMTKIEDGLGTTEETLSPKPEKASLPAPIRPLATSTSRSAVKPENMSMEDYAKGRKNGTIR